MKQYSVTLGVETLELSEEQVYSALRRGLDAMPETPYLGYFSLRLERDEETEEGGQD